MATKGNGSSTTKEAKSEKPGKTAIRGTSLPLFYRRPVPLTADRFAGKSLKRKSDYGFAASTNSLPITVTEFVHASRDYPIVFTPDDPPMPLVVVGIHPANNLFVEPGGAWRKGRFIPAYVRRYPFLFVEDTKQKRLILCIDEQAEMIEGGAAQPLFEDGKPGAVTDRALKFCEAFNKHHQMTRAFATLMAEQALLVPNQAQVTPRQGRKTVVSGFRVVDEKKFNALPDATFLDWRKRGILPLIYAHLMSAANWPTLVELDATSGRPAG